MGNDTSGHSGGGSPNTGPAGMTGVKYDLSGKKYKVHGTKKDAEQVRLDNFEQSRKNRAKDLVKKSKLPGTKVLAAIFQYGAGKASQFFTDKVLSSKKSKKNIGYTQSEFASLDLEKQTEVYESYMSDRMQGRTDAYGNIYAGKGRYENIPHSKGGKVIGYKKTWIEHGNGNNESSQMKTADQIKQENTKIEQEEAEVKITEDEYKKRRGLKGSRSMFARAGGRGFFDAEGTTIV